MRAVAAQSVTSQWQQRKSRRLPPAHFLGKHGLFRFMRKTCWARCTAAACCLAPVALHPWPPAPPLPCPALPLLSPALLLLPCSCPCFLSPAPPLLAQTPFPGPFLPSWATSCLSRISSQARPWISLRTRTPPQTHLRMTGHCCVPNLPADSATVWATRSSCPDSRAGLLGDDVSWKGSGTTRIATIQCASSGMDRHQ